MEKVILDHVHIVNIVCPVTNYLHSFKIEVESVEFAKIMFTAIFSEIYDEWTEHPDFKDPNDIRNGRENINLYNHIKNTTLNANGLFEYRPINLEVVINNGNIITKHSKYK